MKTRTIFISFALIGWFFCYSQNCEENLISAQRAYFNGNLNDVINLMTACVEQGQLIKEDQEDALKLLINSHLILNQDSTADTYMQQLLDHFPLTRVRSTDLTQFKRLYESYDIRPKINFGLQVGFNRPDFQIMQYRSYASFREEPADYNGAISASLGIHVEYALWKDLYLGAEMLYQNHIQSHSEVLLDVQRLEVRERLNYLNVPIYLKYAMRVLPIQVYLAAGMNTHFLLTSKADLTLLATAPIYGNSGQVEDYDLSFQRNKVNFNYTFGGGIKKQFGKTAIELGAFYDYGLNNLVTTNERYSRKELLEDFSYVPDDFKMDHLRFTINIVRTIYKAKKK